LLQTFVQSGGNTEKGRLNAFRSTGSAMFSLPKFRMPFLAEIECGNS